MESIFQEKTMITSPLCTRPKSSAQYSWPLTIALDKIFQILPFRFSCLASRVEELENPTSSTYAPADLTRPVLMTPVLMTPVLMTPVLMGLVLMTPVLMTPVLMGPVLMTPVLMGPVLIEPVLMTPVLMGPVRQHRTALLHRQLPAILARDDYPACRRTAYHQNNALLYSRNHATSHPLCHATHLPHFLPGTDTNQDVHLSESQTE